VRAFQTLNITTGQSAEGVTRHDPAERSRNGNGERRREAEHVFENQITGKEEQEFIWNRKTDDTQNEKGKDTEVSVLADPNR
jgi:hypothetical protein